MVTFRFYVVSTVAFFLALAVGVVVGSVLDGQIADSLQDRLNGVEQSLDETVAAMDARKAELDRNGSYIEESAPYAVAGRLEETATLVVADNGVQAAPVEDLVRRLRDGGSRVEGIIWLDRRFSLDDPQDLAVAAEILRQPLSATPQEVRAALWDQMLGVDPESRESMYAGDVIGPDGEGEVPTSTGVDPSQSTSTTTTTTTLAPPLEVVPLMLDGDAIAALAEAGLLRIQVIDGETGTAAQRLLVTGVTGPESSLGQPGVEVAEMVRIAAGARLPAVLGEVVPPPASETDADPPRGEILDELADAGANGVSTVDDLDLEAGRVATVLALAEGLEGLSGRYGYGPGVDGVVPPWQGP
ncbi:MAG: copper transporter [Microthrixaceae bacterium]